MSVEERRASQGARRLQAVIASVAQQSRGRSLDEAVDLLQVNLTMAGLRAPSGPWLDDVAREAVAGRSYVVATDALLLGLDDTAQAEALEHAPAELTTRVADRPSQPPTGPPHTPTAGGTARPDADKRPSRSRGGC